MLNTHIILAPNFSNAATIMFFTTFEKLIDVVCQLNKVVVSCPMLRQIREIMLHQICAQPKIYKRLCLLMSPNDVVH